MTNIPKEPLIQQNQVYGQNPLHSAIIQSDNSTGLTALNELLNQKDLPKDSIFTALMQKDNQDYTPLALAVSVGRIDMVKAILGSDVVKNLSPEDKQQLFWPRTSEYSRELYEKKPTLFYMVIDGAKSGNSVELYKFLYNWVLDNGVNCDDLFCGAHDHVPISVLHYPLALQNSFKR